MVVNATWLIDKSALARLGHSPDAAEWATRIQRGLVHVSTVTRLEVGFSACPGADLARIFANVPISAIPVEYLTPATAELGGHAILYLDKDFELIAALTGQPMERLNVLA